MYELLKVKAARLLWSSFPVGSMCDDDDDDEECVCVCVRLWTTVTVWGSCTGT